MNNLIFNVLMALIVAIAGIIARQLMPYLKAKKDEAMTKLRQTQWSWAADIIDAVVRAVEQTVSEEIHGQDKKLLAVQYIAKYLQQAGIELSMDQIDSLIEAAVQQMNADTVQLAEPVEYYDEDDEVEDEGMPE